MVDQVIEVERTMSAEPWDVFGFLTDAERYARWMGRAAELDPRPGGVYRVEFSPETVALGEYVEVIEPSRIVFTFGWIGNPEVPPGSTTVEIDLEPSGSGTRVRLRHFGVPGDDAIALHAEGWEHYLTRLVIAAEGGTPPPDG